ncbi:Peroxisomal trans-2-enoyl-CoA reductase [Nymphon striatum]|nr:Peroxisomal trans-2-enoyl-CoA reductase [Nymphon striatum]
MAKAAATSVFKKGLFSGKNAIVSGGGTGIGKAIAAELLYLGCNVIICSRKETVLNEAVKHLENAFCKNSGSSISSIVCNIRKEDQVDHLIQSAVDKYGKVDFLVNNGGGQFLGKLSDITLKGWQAVLETNLTGTFLMCQKVYQKSMQKHGGQIVNITMDHERGFPLMGHSAASRSGVTNLTKTMAVEWAADGVRVNCVAPGNAIYSKTAIENYDSSAVFEHAREQNPSKRLGTPEEISSAVCFLLSPGSSFISGHTLFVDSASSLYRSGGIPIPEHENLPAYKWQSS